MATATVTVYANLPQTTVLTGGTDAPVSGTQESWTVASSSEFPAASNTASPPTWFHVADQASGKSSEIIAVTDISGTAWTVTRGAEGTTPVTHSAGFTVYQVISAGDLGSFLASGNNLSDVASASTARANLGLGAAALLGTPVPVADGGTGAASAGQNDFFAGPSSGGPGAPSFRAITAADVPTLNQSTTGSSGSCTGNAATAGNLEGGAALPAYLAPAVAALTDGATISVNAALGNVFTVTLGGNRAMGAPSNPVDGQVIRFRVTQDGTGSRTLTWNSVYDFGSGSAPTLTTTAYKTDILAFEYVATTIDGSPLDRWCYLGASIPQGF
jgi:hypothetical protein